MLKRVDRVQIAVTDRNEAERAVAEVFGGELIRRDEIARLHARRSTMQAGASHIDLLTPDGAGPIADFIGTHGGGLYGVGFSVADVDAAARHFESKQVGFTREGAELYLDPNVTFGLNAVICAFKERKPVGAIRWIYETTNVVASWQAASRRYADIFALDASKFCPISSPEFGYTGTLTMFDSPARLDRIEISQTTADTKAMGRFHMRRGDSLYMFFVETDDVSALCERLDERGGKYASWRRDEAGLAEAFIHPSAFLGVLVGVSRTEHAWLWSGDPERSRRAAKERAAR